MTARNLAEYRRMFALSDAALLAGPVLDCPGGAGSFAAELRALGGRATSADPIYGLSARRLGLHVRRQVERAVALVAGDPARYRWSSPGSPAEHARMRRAAAERFLDDIARDRRPYIAAALPELPFADGAFRLVLCAYLLFVYPPLLDVEAHVASLATLARVAQDEARVYPLVDGAGVPYGELDRVRASLERHGVESELRHSADAFLRDADLMLVLAGSSTRD